MFETYELTIMDIILLILIICIVLSVLVFILYELVCHKIHLSYHKGYNKANDDKVQYYKTIKEIIDSYNEIFTELTKDNSNNMYKASILKLMINFKKNLENYYKN